MENEAKTITLDGNSRKITLRGYYKSLPNRICPKSEFIHKIANLCGVTDVTVRNWLLYSTRPTNPEHIAILSEETGIAKEDLWIE